MPFPLVDDIHAELSEYYVGLGPRDEGDQVNAVPPTGLIDESLALVINEAVGGAPAAVPELLPPAVEPLTPGDDGPKGGAPDLELKLSSSRSTRLGTTKGVGPTFSKRMTVTNISHTMVMLRLYTTFLAFNLFMLVYGFCRAFPSGSGTNM